jgi:hypothetical protein
MGVRIRREEWSPLITGVRGCIAYYAVDAGGGTIFTVSIFEETKLVRLRIYSTSCS